MTVSQRSPAERLAVLDGGGLVEESLVAMVRAGDSVVGEASLPDRRESLQLEATVVRRERTGLHARIEIRVGAAVAAYGVLNVERDEDRTRLANSAAKRVGDAKRWGEPIKLRLDQFVLGLWEAWVRGEEAELLRPSSVGEAPGWIVRPFALEGAGTILFAPPGAAKSWTGILLAVGLEHGGLPWETRHGRALFVNLERSADSLRWRLACARRALGAARADLLVLNRRGRSFVDVAESVAATIRRESVDLVIVDSLSRMGTGKLTADDDANRAMDMLNALGCAWLVLGHSPRADASHAFGSVMFDAAADLCIRLGSAPAENTSTLGVRFEVTKANDVRKPPPFTVAYDFDDDGLLAVREARSGEFPDLSGGAVPIGSQLAALLGAVGGMSATDAADELGLERSRVAHVFAEDSRFTRVGRDGKRILWGLAAVPGLGG